MRTPTAAKPLAPAEHQISCVTDANMGRFAKERSDFLRSGASGQARCEQRLRGPGELVNCAGAPGDRHEERLGRSLDNGTLARAPFDVRRDELPPTHPLPGTERWGHHREVECTAQPLGWDFACDPERTSDVLVVDERVGEGDPPAEHGGQSSGFEMSPGALNQIIGRTRDLPFDAD